MYAGDEIISDGENTTPAPARRPLPRVSSVQCVLEYCAYGQTTPRRVLVTELDPYIKNGKPGFVGYIVGHLGDPEYAVWGMDSQITRVLSVV